MEQTRETCEAGFTLVEIVVVVAIVVTTVLAGVAISLGSRSFAVATAASEFDHLLDSARTVARETQGATLVFSPDVFGDGTEVRVLAPGPNGTLSPTKLPPFHTRAAIEESESLGKAPFAFVVHATGALGGRPGYRTGNPATIPEVGCPARGWFHFLIHAAGATAERTLPCRITLAATGPLTLAPFPVASVAPLPTPCSSGSCGPSALPTPPSSTPTCPPNFTTISTGCTPSSGTNSAPNYHVIATLASPTTIVGGTDSIVAQATLTNASMVASGTPITIPVYAEPSSNCSVSPTSPQPSTATFLVLGLVAGSCVIEVTADTTDVAGAIADSAAVNVTVGSPPAGAPSPPACDLVDNGFCYSRVIGATTMQFEKDVIPDVACGDSDGATNCWYINSIRQITLTPYTLSLLSAADTQERSLLFRITKIAGLTYGCLPYALFSGIPGGAPLPYLSTGIGAPVNIPIGFGQPSTYAHEKLIAVGPPGIGTSDDTATSKNVAASLLSLINAIAERNIGPDFRFSYFATNAQAGVNINWFPDFPGCDAVGDPNVPDPQFGYSAVTLEFEIYQRVS
ncbi:MAG TPA: hypothetical protein VK669_01260 [Candidatus Limnocylindrales bacterium]|nr:hypothetical protein [Candidatus Limnocylindrales bacterium]